MKNYYNLSIKEKIDFLTNNKEQIKNLINEFDRNNPFVEVYILSNMSEYWTKSYEFYKIIEAVEIEFVHYGDEQILIKDIKQFNKECLVQALQSDDLDEKDICRLLEF